MLFVGGLLIGTGVGMVLDNTVAGLLIGAGVGVILEGWAGMMSRLLRPRRRRHD